MVRLAAYGGVSCVLAGYVVFSAFRQRSNFFAAAVYLSKSNACMMILWNMGVFLTVLFGRALQSIFFGPLRLLEVERLHERAWYAVTESLLALTIFREEFDTSFVVLFVSLLFLKVFHWLAADRVEMMEQAPSIPRSFYIRMFSLLSLLQTIDFLLVAYAAQTILVDGPSVMIMFASEYMILLATLVATYAKFGVNCYDLRSEVPWDNKSVWIFYIDLACDFVKLATYLGFFSLILTFYGLPLNILRDVYITARSFVIKVRDLARYRQATRNMDQRYPNATAEEMERMSDKTCIICREDMEARQATPAVAPAQPAQAPENPQPAPAAVAAAPGRQGPNDTPKKLPCGHIFHFHCLRSWLERQQSCPTCRRPVLTPSTSSTANRGRPPIPQPPAQAQPGAAAPPQPGAVPRPTHLAVPGQAAPATATARPNDTPSRRRAGAENPLVAFASPAKPSTTVQPILTPTTSSVLQSSPDSSKKAETAASSAIVATTTSAQHNSTTESTPSDERAKRRAFLEAAARARQATASPQAKVNTTTDSSSTTVSAQKPDTPPQTPSIRIDAPSSPSSNRSAHVPPTSTAIPVPQIAVSSPTPLPTLQWQPATSPGVMGSTYPQSRFVPPMLRPQSSAMPRLIPLFDPVNPTQPSSMARLFPTLLQSSDYKETLSALSQQESPVPFANGAEQSFPESLTEEQLSIIGQATTDGIRARLKLLQSTRDTLSTSIRQLQTAMSLLDPDQIQAAAEVAAELGLKHNKQPNGDEIGHTAEDMQDKGKGKQREQAVDDATTI